MVTKTQKASTRINEIARSQDIRLKSPTEADSFAGRRKIEVVAGATIRYYEREGELSDEGLLAP